MSTSSPAPPAPPSAEPRRRPLDQLLGTLRHHGVAAPPHPNDVVAEARTLGDRVADSVASTAGSWPFIFLVLIALAAWVVYNGLAGARSFDPYPFILLNLVLSCVAALQAPVIMMSQNRQAERDRLHADLDYRVNVKAELELVQLRAELDELRRQQWEALVHMQEEQIRLLQQLADARSGGAPRDRA